MRSRSSLSEVNALACPLPRASRSASSSCSLGMPKTAITASPMYFSTVPPCRSSTLRISSKNLVITRRTVSGSSSSPIGVEPTTSQKTIETVFLAMPSAGAAVSGLAHDIQNRAGSGLSRPHDPQTGMSVSVGTEP